MRAKAIWIVVLAAALALLLLISASLAQPEEGPARTTGPTEAEVQGAGDGGAIESVGVIVNQLPNAVVGVFTDAGCDACGSGAQVLAENFVLATPQSIAQVVMWTGYFPGDVPIDPDVFTVTVHADGGGVPGADLYTEANVAYTRYQSGRIVAGVHEYVHVLTLADPVGLGPGAYWIEIYNDTGLGTDDFFWETGDPDTAGSGLPGLAWSTTAPGGAWNSDPVTDLAMQIVTTDDLPLLYGAAKGVTGTFAESRLFAIDHRTGISVPIGLTGFDSVTGLAFLDDGRLVGSARGDDMYGGVPTAILVEIDTETGAGTLIGPISDENIGCGRMPDLTYDPVNDILYGYGDFCLGAPEGLFVIDPDTGVGTSVGASGYSGGGNGMAIDPATGIIYATPFDNGSLVILDPATGAGADVPGSAGNVPSRVNALDVFPGRGALYGSWNAGGASYLVRISKVDGTTAVIGQSALGLDALAFASPRIAIDPPALSSVQGIDEITFHTLAISNTGVMDLIWTFSSTVPPKNLPEYAPPVLESVPSDLPQGSAFTDLEGSPSVAPDVAAPDLATAPSRYRGAEGLAYYSDRAAFNADYPGLPLEDFEGTLVPAGSILACDGPFDFTTNNACFPPGAIKRGIRFQSGVGPHEDMVVLGAGTYMPTSLIGPNTFTETFDILFIEGGVYAVGMDVLDNVTESVLIDIYGPDNVLLGQTSVPTGMPGVFWGVGSDRPILRIRLHSAGGSGGEVVDNVAFGYGPCGVPWANTAPAGGALPPGAGIPATVTFDASGMPVGTYTGDLCIESNDPQVSLATVPVTMTVIPDADLWISKTAPAEVLIHTDFVYTLDYGNDGPSPAPGTVISDSLPAEVTFLSASDASCSEASGIVTCSPGALAPGATASIDISLRATAVGTAVNDAAIQSAAPDPDTGNNSASATTEILPHRVYLPIVLRNLTP